MTTQATSKYIFWRNFPSENSAQYPGIRRKRYQVSTSVCFLVAEAGLPSCSPSLQPRLGVCQPNPSDPCHLGGKVDTQDLHFFCDPCWGFCGNRNGTYQRFTIVLAARPKSHFNLALSQIVEIIHNMGCQGCQLHAKKWWESLGKSQHPQLTCKYLGLTVSGHSCWGLGMVKQVFL